MLEFLDHYWGVLFGGLVSCLLLISGVIGSVFYWRRERRCTHSASAVVFRSEKVEGDAGKTYKSWVRFEVAGITYEVADQTSHLPAAHDVGVGVTVYYPPNDPQQALIGRWRSLGPFVFLSLLGAAGLAAVAGYLIYS